MSSGSRTRPVIPSTFCSASLDPDRSRRLDRLSHEPVQRLGAAATWVSFRFVPPPRSAPLRGLFAALLLAFSPSFWGEANVQRVYSLNALFVALASAAAFAWYRRERSTAPWFVSPSAFAASGRPTTPSWRSTRLASSFSPSSAIPAVCVGSALVAVLAFAAGLFPYLYLPLRSRADPLFDWGNPETLGASSTSSSPRLLGASLDRSARGPPRHRGGLPPGVGESFRGWSGCSRWSVPSSVRRRRSPVVAGAPRHGRQLRVMGLHGSRSDILSGTATTFPPM